MSEFKFKIASTVNVMLSGSVGEVLGRAQYKECPNQYLVQYLNGIGDSTTTWFSESELGLLWTSDAETT